MTNKAIFIKVIEKAENNGYKLRPEIDRSQYYIKYTYQGVHFHSKNDDFAYFNETIFDIIFSHEFVEKFFYCDHKCKPYRSGAYYDECEKCEEIRPLGLDWYTFKDHLKDMVVEKEPLKYLEKYLTVKTF